MIDLDKSTNEEVAALLFAMEEETSWASHCVDYEIRDEYFDACEHLLSVLNKEYTKRNINLTIVG